MIIGLLVYAVIAFLYWFWLMSYVLVNGQKIKYAKDLKNLENNNCPSVVIIIAVRNEQQNLKEALQSICHLKYPNYKILVINDRSTDDSFKILQQLQTEYSKIKIINIDHLPPGWLGKNHALYTGYNFSSEEYVLFTDADVIFDKDVLSKAMNYLIQNNLDHLTILPGIIGGSDIFKSVLSTFIIILSALQRPWAVKNKGSKASIGVGAFNLVKRSAYIKAGTHKAIAMRPDDDLKLAAFLKKTGSNSDVLYGNDVLELEWYSNIREFINGLMKNAFSGFNYNVWLLAGGVTGMLLLFIIPVPLLLVVGNTLERLLMIGVIICQLLLYALMPGGKGKWWYGFMSIYGSLILVYILIRSGILTLSRGGIVWRGTFYSLKELRKANTAPTIK